MWYLIFYFVISTIVLFIIKLLYAKGILHDNEEEDDCDVEVIAFFWPVLLAMVILFSPYFIIKGIGVLFDIMLHKNNKQENQEEKKECTKDIENTEDTKHNVEINMEG